LGKYIYPYAIIILPVKIIYPTIYRNRPARGGAAGVRNILEFLARTYHGEKA
jgi:hypothetical protein